jgi:HTH-type transcriptional regulator, sugar sensing transcriptional regulator
VAGEIEVLKKLGLEEREAKIYLALLRLGSSTATKLSEELDIDRTTIYDILNRLITKGIVSYAIKQNIKNFSAVEPGQLLKELRDKEEELKEIMPRLIKISESKKEHTSVEIFKGKEGLISVFKSILKDKKDYIMIGAMHEISEAIPLPVYKFVNEAFESNVKGKILCEEGFGDSDLDIIGKNEEYRLISKEFSSTTLQVWGNKTAFYIFTDPYYTILIESKEIADRNRLYFDTLWKQAKIPSKEHRRKTLVK